MADLGKLQVLLEANTTKLEAGLKKAKGWTSSYVKDLDRVAKAATKLEASQVRTAASIAATNKATASAQAVLGGYAARMAAVDAAAKSAAASQQLLAKATKAASDAAGKGAKDGRTPWRMMATELNSILALLSIAKRTIEAVFEAAYEGAQNLSAAEFFKGSGKDIDSYRRATMGLVADAQLMKKANMADAMGISGETFKRLALVAKASALKTGQSYDYMFDSIMLGTARSSRLLLDNLGIVVSVETANHNYAKALKESDKAGKYKNMTVAKLANSLSDYGKKVAFAEEVMRQSQGTMEEWTELGDQVVTSYDKAKASMQNLADVIKEKLATALKDVMPIAKSFFDTLTIGIQGENWGLIGKYIGYSMLQGLMIALDSGQQHIFKMLMGPLGILIPTDKMPKTDAMTNAAAEYARLAYDAQASIKEAALRKTFMGHSGQAELDKSLAELNEQMAGISKGAALTIKQLADTLQKGGKNGAIALLLSRTTTDAEGAAYIADVVEKLLKDDVKNRTGLRLPPKPKPTPDVVDASEGGGRTKKPPKEKGVKEEKEKKPYDWKYALAQAARRVLEAQESMMEGHLKVIRAVVKASTEASRVIADTWFAALQGRSVGRTISRNLQGEINESILDAMLAPARASAWADGSFSGEDAASIEKLAKTLEPAVGGIGAAVSIILQLTDEIESFKRLVDMIVEGAKKLVFNALNPFFEALKHMGPVIFTLLASIGALIGVVLEPVVSQFRLFGPILGAIIQAVSSLIIVLAVFARLLSGVYMGLVDWVFAFINVVGHIVSALFGFEWDVIKAGEILQRWADSVKHANYVMMKGAVDFYNAVAKFMRNTFGIDMKDMKLSDLMLQPDLLDANTRATLDNTSATRDLIQEFRNLPSWYRVQGAVFNATPEAMPSRGGGFSSRQIVQATASQSSVRRWRRT
jgi:hypothetical protein